MLWIIARLQDGVTAPAAQMELSSLLQGADAPSAAEIGANVESMDQVLRGDLRPDLLLICAGTALLLLIACVNVATMCWPAARRECESSRCERRSAHRGCASRASCSRKTSCWPRRVALPARSQPSGRSGMLDALLPSALAARVSARVDWEVLLFLIAVSLATTVVFGLLPAFVPPLARPGQVRHPEGGSRTGARCVRSAGCS